MFINKNKKKDFIFFNYSNNKHLLNYLHPRHLHPPPPPHPPPPALLQACHLPEGSRAIQLREYQQTLTAAIAASLPRSTALISPPNSTAFVPSSPVGTVINTDLSQERKKT